jgi:hypothetical protein
VGTVSGPLHRHNCLQTMEVVGRRIGRGVGFGFGPPRPIFGFLMEWGHQYMYKTKKQCPPSKILFESALLFEVSPPNKKSTQTHTHTQTNTTTHTPTHTFQFQPHNQSPGDREGERGPKALEGQLWVAVDPHSSNLRVHHVGPKATHRNRIQRPKGQFRRPPERPQVREHPGPQVVVEVPPYI